MADEEKIEETTEEEAAAPEAESSDLVAESDQVAVAPAEAEPAAAEPAAQATPPEPKRKKKRLPRALRPAKSRPKRAPKPAGERSPIVREPKPERERGRRQERRGVVVSNAMEKTIVVKVDVIRSHPRYKKVIRRSVKFHAHDEKNAANVGDVVRIVETRPLSATKHWRLVEIVEAAK